MKTGLRVFSLLALFSLIGVSVWATQHVGIVDSINSLIAHAGDGATNPWFIATLFDAYFGFLWFWLWVAYKQTGWLSRIVWLLLILAGGNIVMAIYVLIQLARLPADAKIEDLLLRRRA